MCTAFYTLIFVTQPTGVKYSCYHQYRFQITFRNFCSFLSLQIFKGSICLSCVMKNRECYILMAFILFLSDFEYDFISLCYFLSIHFCEYHIPSTYKYNLCKLTANHTLRFSHSDDTKHLVFPISLDICSTYEHLNEVIMHITIRVIARC